MAFGHRKILDDENNCIRDILEARGLAVLWLIKVYTGTHAYANPHQQNCDSKVVTFEPLAGGPFHRIAMGKASFWGSHLLDQG